MKKLISFCLASICALSLSACSGGEIEASEKPFPEFTASDFDGKALSNEMFGEYDVTIVNFWSNSCGSCIQEMPELEEYYQNFKDKNINLIGVAVSAGASDEEYQEAKRILKEKGVSYSNLIVNPESSFYQEFVKNITGYPTTYIVDKNGNMVGVPLIGVVSNQEDKLMKRIDGILS